MLEILINARKPACKTRKENILHASCLESKGIWERFHKENILSSRGIRNIDKYKENRLQIFGKKSEKILYMQVVWKAKLFERDFTNLSTEATIWTVQDVRLTLAHR